MKSECTTCAGTGEIEMATGDGSIRKYECPMCDGHGYQDEYEYQDREPA